MIFLRQTIPFVTSFILLTAADLEAQQKGEPFEGIDQSWQNGSDRRDSSVFRRMKYFMPSVLMDVSYPYSFNNPVDNTVVGSTALARNNEVQLSAMHSADGTAVRILILCPTRD